MQAANETLATGLSQCCAEPGGNGNSALLSVVQEDRLDGGWSPVISDYDRVTNPKALREPEGCHLCNYCSTYKCLSVSQLCNVNSHCQLL